MTATIHKGFALLQGENRIHRSLSFHGSRIPARVRLFCVTGLFMTGTAQAHAVVPPPPTPAALAHELEQRDSATATLQRHCPIPVTAHLLDRHAPETLQRNARLTLKASPTARLDIRHVQLLCGTQVWSEAWNLYLPDRLSSQARQTLADGHTPFGKAVGEASFFRQRLNSHFTNLPPNIVLENRAILHRRTDEKGFSYLTERYTAATLTVRKPQETSSDAVRHQEPASAP